MSCDASVNLFNRVPFIKRTPAVKQRCLTKTNGASFILLRVPVWSWRHALSDLACMRRVKLIFRLRVYFFFIIWKSNLSEKTDIFLCAAFWFPLSRVLYAENSISMLTKWALGLTHCVGKPQSACIQLTDHQQQIMEKSPRKSVPFPASLLYSFSQFVRCERARGCSVATDGSV